MPHHAVTFAAAVCGNTSKTATSLGQLAGTGRLRAFTRFAYSIAYVYVIRSQVNFCVESRQKPYFESSGRSALTSFAVSPS